jgi:diacylglycerol kinase (ATP)
VFWEEELASGISVKITVDDRPPEHFAVMAGIGVDAMIMDETDDNLTDKVGSAAYFVAAGKALGRLPVPMRVQLDDSRPVRRDAMLCVVGNVGKLRSNLTLILGARPDDGVLDLYIASPRRFGHWIKLALRLITRRPKRGDQVDQHSGRRVGIRIDGKDNYQLDGDVDGKSVTLTAEIQPGALTVCTPAPAPRILHHCASAPPMLTPLRAARRACAAPACTSERYPEHHLAQMRTDDARRHRGYR